MITTTIRMKQLQYLFDLRKFKTQLINLVLRSRTYIRNNFAELDKLTLWLRNQ